jgi:acyl carrier protein
MNIKIQIREFLNECLLYYNDSIHFGDDESFLERNLIDSTTIMELVLFVEEKYNLEILDSEITPDNFDSISKIADYVRVKTTSNQKSLDVSQ